MRAFKVIAEHPWTGEKKSRYLVSEEEKVLLGDDAKFEPVDIHPAAFLENKATRSTAFSDWLLEHK